MPSTCSSISETLPDRIVLEGAFNKSAVTHMIFNRTGDEMLGFFFSHHSCAPSSLVHAFAINQGPLKLSSWSLLPDWFWATDSSGRPTHRTRAVYYSGPPRPPPAPMRNDGTVNAAPNVSGHALAHKARRLRTQLRRATQWAAVLDAAPDAAATSRTTAPLCCDGNPTCNGGGTGAQAPVLYRFEMPPLATDSGKGARFTALGEMLGDFEPFYPPQLCAGMGSGAVQAMPTTCTSIADTMHNRAVFLSQYNRGRATHMIFVSRECILFASMPPPPLLAALYTAWITQWGGEWLTCRRGSVFCRMLPTPCGVHTSSTALIALARGWSGSTI
jgi:hypothetical protein